MSSQWPVLERVVEYETGWYQGGFDLVEQPDGTTKRYYWASLPPAVVIVATIEDQLVFVEQYRPTIRQHHLELPAGIVEPDEDYCEAAKRELREETGYEAGSLEFIQEVQAATGILDHQRGYVFASELTEGEPLQDSNEFLTIRHIQVDDAVQLVRAPPTNDSSLMGILLAKADGHL